MNKLSDYSLVWKLLLVPVVALSGFAMYLTYSSVVLLSGNALLKEIRDTDFPILNVAGKNLEIYEDVAVALNMAAATGEVELLDVAKNKASELLDGYEILEKLDTEHRSQIEKLKSGFNAYFAQAIDVAQRLTTKAGMPGAAQIMKMRDARDAYLSASVSYRDFAEKEFHNTVGEAIERSESARVWGAVIGVFMLIVIAVLTLLVTRGIVALEKRVKDRSRMLAEVNSELEHEIEKLKAAELQLRDLSSHLQSVREEEKTSIAREVHDDLGGTLAALKIGVYLLADNLSASNETAPFLEQVQSMSHLIDDAVGATRRIISDLRPTVLDDLGLMAALEWQCAQFHQRTGIECRVNCIEDKGGLDNQRSIALFRILQEAMTNVSRHSGASRVEIEFHHNDEEVVLSIIDNGRGMPEGNSISPNSYGIRGMRERTGQLNGKIMFDTPLGSGFCVTVILPLSASNNEEERT